MEVLLVSAFTIGLLGSLHCIGMCGGLVTAITMSREKVWWPGLISYQLARVSSYMLLGAMIAAIGINLHGENNLQSTQVWLGYFAAAIMVLFALNLGGWMPDPLSRFTGTIMRVTGLSRWSKQANEQDKLPPWLMVGMLNGLLPCGLVYAGLALSLTANSPLEGALVMLAFGAGTIPAMLFTPYLMRTLTPQLRGTLLKVAAVALIILAIFTASRNLLHGDHNHATSNTSQPHAEHVMPQPVEHPHPHHGDQHPVDAAPEMNHHH
ncbi:MAG: sulfite exporter TauE/SafE family protein [Gammaproteobacteria bacterium]|nr:sulfite exporter TauE/SafE family protein [Gammaproteobacteria bacterium]MCF6229202.1 sulfite exporter TauE/SafE family protein [Gammaproteobacteria bacterium]